MLASILYRPLNPDPPPTLSAHKHGEAVAKWIKAGVASFLALSLGCNSSFRALGFRAGFKRGSRVKFRFRVGGVYSCSLGFRA